jgi:hypothetical protein
MFLLQDKTAIFLLPRVFAQNTEGPLLVTKKE